MYICKITETGNIHQYEELVKVFLRPDEYIVFHDENEKQHRSFDYDRVFRFNGDKNLLKREIYKSLQQYTGKSPKWGIVTGIRPVKMAGELFKEYGNLQHVKDVLEKDFLMNEEKSKLTLEILQYQLETAGLPKQKSLSMYIGIPFCPTRCLYCSFTSNQVPEKEIDRYLNALIKEIDYAGEAIEREGWNIESLYIGGGTPTTLNESQLGLLFEKINKSFNVKNLREYTLEAGRPDTLTRGKLDLMRNYGVGRISINPQTMKQATLDLIGRKHNVKDVTIAFEMARNAGISIINADIIAGLPEETFEDFSSSLDKITLLNPENITLHTLAVKRASRLKEMDAEFNYRNEELREKMLLYALETLRSKGYRPYYLYRQKHTSGNTENMGFCKNNSISVYNIRIMEEAQSIFALGAGGISKIYFPDENRLERVPNVSNYEIYINRIDDMIERKAQHFFGQVL